MVIYLSRKMLNSGIRWIGKIPEGWNRVSMIRTLREPITDGPHETPEYVNNGIPFISVDSLGQSEEVNLNIVKKFISEEDYKLYNKKTNLTDGDILFTKAATIGKTAIVDSSIKFMVWSPIAVIKSNADIIYNKYLYYILNSNKFINHARLLGTSNTQINVGMGNLEKAMIPLPFSIKEQKSIAYFLDNKVLEINNIILKTKKNIKNYKNYKQSLITETVTKGLTKNVAMKDSEVKWIGNIPRHWQTEKLKYKYNIISGTTPKSKNENWDGIILWITPADYNTSDIYIKNSNRKITEHAIKNTSLTIIPINSIIVSNRAPIGKIALNSKKITINQGCKALISNEKTNNKYTYYTLSIYSNILNMLGKGTTFLELSGRELSNFIISKPPLNEQEQIVNYLDKRCNEIDNIISTKEKLLTEMEAYKNSLIYETVTGKREVE